jgi:hypothetical protein
MPYKTRNCGDWAKCGVTFGTLTAILWCRLVELYRRFGGTGSEVFVLFIKLHGVTPRSMAAFKIEGFLMIKHVVLLVTILSYGV